MKIIEKIIERKNESESTKLERFLKLVKQETKDQIEKLKKENETFKNTIKKGKEKIVNEIDEISESIDDFLLNVDAEEIKDKDSRKEYAKEFICGYMDKLYEIEVLNNKLERTEKTLNEHLETNNNLILKLQTLLNELK